MTRFRPCIDLHAGSVKQIVGGTLSTTEDSSLKTNFTSEHPSAYYASLYKKHNLTGAHVIMLGPGNDSAAQEALEAWKGGLQVGGGITEKNAREWIERGAEKVSSTRIILCEMDCILIIISLPTFAMSMIARG
jgi:phosphoribosylformimino-5-aminoimidazole carboxamide ribotide isomerase